MKHFAALILASALAVPLGASPVSRFTPTSQNLPSVVYRGDQIPPEQYKKDGGIPPEFTGDMTERSYSLWWHNLGTDNYPDRDFQSAYAATSTEFAVAVSFAIKDNPNEAGWIYRIHATPNMIDLAHSDFRPIYLEREFAAVGGIRWDQVEAWLEVPKNVSAEKGAGGIRQEERKRWQTAEDFEKEFPDLKWVNNPDYNPVYDQYRVSQGQPQLAGVPEGRRQGPLASEFAKENKTLEQHAIEFMDKVGAPVGWKGAFPLDLKAPVNSQA
ncbi:heat-labile enterotoxin alpha chain [Metarhizium robertsii]|uniref:Heat-labile enterotoxin alpha chain n=1 Tax=Metarhizium robertsii TaxID=568076 RepID=A0A014NZT8_9HYPO|nr:heat-labile enterotoxin alpha chain [Metarhizium robertsii]